MENTDGAPLSLQLSRRERQIMDAAFELGEASARQIHGAIPDAPSYSSIRAQLAILLEKGHLKFRQDGARYLYSPAVSVDSARDGAIHRLVKTFFGGSAGEAATALLGAQAETLEAEELDALEALLRRERARRDGNA